ncbi:MAG: DNA polymerase III subunit gamma/tau [Anaerolineae bacterium]|nr:DNA polymerase III subunit gamma/tau [Anaerolineae bacterium]
MANETLYLRWRSQTFDDVVGQAHVTRTLRNACRAGRVAHAYLFSGPRGTGKTSVARILAKALNCQGEGDERPCNQCDACRAISEGRYLDLIEIDGASNRGIDEIRDLREKVNFRPNQGRYKVYIIDEVHMLTREAFNALLKTLEEPPDYVIFVFATTEVWRVPATIRSRCQRFDFRPIKADLIEARLRQICEAEHYGHDDAALALIARQATGSMRDAISMLDQIVSVGEGMVTADLLREVLGTAPDEAAETLLGLVLDGNLAEALEFLEGLASEGLDMQQFVRDLLELTRALLLVRLGVQPEGVLSPEAVARLAQSARDLEVNTLRHVAGALAQAADQVRHGHLPQLPLELAMVDISGLLNRPIPHPAEAAAPVVPKAPPAVRPHALPDRQGEQRQEPATAGPVRQQEEPPSLERARKMWPKVAAKVHRRDRTLEALLRSSEPCGLEGDTLTIAFAYPFHHACLGGTEEERVLAQAVAEVLGRSLRIVRVVQAPGTAVERQADSDAAGEPKEIPVDEDPLYQVARELGGRVRVIDDGGSTDEQA